MTPIRRIAFTIALGGILWAMLVVQNRVSAQQKTTKAGESKSDLQALQEKIDRLLATQQAIQEQLKTITEELQVVKVRCTK